MFDDISYFTRRGLELARDEERVENITPVNKTYLNETNDESLPLPGFGPFVGVIALFAVALRKRL